MGGRVMLIHNNQEYDIGSRTNPNIQALISNYNSNPPPGAVQQQPCMYQYRVKYQAEFTEDYIFLYGSRTLMSVAHISSLDFL
jgi:hypothetical protein